MGCLVEKARREYFDHGWKQLCSGRADSGRYAGVGKDIAWAVVEALKAGSAWNVDVVVEETRTAALARRVKIPRNERASSLRKSMTTE